MTENPSTVELVAQLAAERATATLAPRVLALETAPAPEPAWPAGLESRLKAIEDALQLVMAPPPPPPTPLTAEDRLLIDDLRLATADAGRRLGLLEKKENR